MKIKFLLLLAACLPMLAFAQVEIESIEEVAAPAPTDIVIYAANGQLICQVTDTHLAVRCASGVYLVRVGRRTVKVVVE